MAEQRSLPLPNLTVEDVLNGLAALSLILAGMSVFALYIATEPPFWFQYIAPFSNTIITIGGGVLGWQLYKRRKIF